MPASSVRAFLPPTACASVSHTTPGTVGAPWGERTARTGRGRHTTTRPSPTPSRMTTSDRAPEAVHGLDARAAFLATITASPLELGRARPASGDLALLGYEHRTQAPACHGVHSPRARVAHHPTAPSGHAATSRATGTGAQSSATARDQQSGRLPHSLPRGGRVALVAQPGHEPGHNHEGHAGTLAADASKDMRLLRPSRQGCPVVPGGRYPRRPARCVVTAARKAGTRSSIVLSFPQALSVPLIPHRAMVAGLPRPGQGGTRGPRPPGEGCHCRRSGDPRWTTGSASAVPRVGRGAVLGPG